MKSKKVEEMSFAEWQMVLSEGTPEDSDKVWSELKGKALADAGPHHRIDCHKQDRDQTDAGG